MNKTTIGIDPYTGRSRRLCAICGHAMSQHKRCSCRNCRIYHCDRCGCDEVKTGMA